MITIRKLSSLVILLSLFCISTLSQVSSGDVNAGKKQFYKLVNNNGKTCAECHYFIEGDTINWNPSAPDLAARVKLYTAEGLGKYFDKPTGDVLKTSHAGYSLSGNDENDLVAFLASLNTSPPVPPKPFKIRLLLFSLFIVFLILLRIEKNRIRKIPVIARKILILATWTGISVIIVQDAIALNRSKDYAPVQPIKFSHLIHATNNQIECNYCHSGVLKGKSAGIPPVSLCMNCHKHLPKGTRTGFFEIRKITESYENKTPIRWIRVDKLPDYTYFNHMQHVKIAKINCITCHGDVKSMHIIKQVEDLSMGWCIKCHDTRAVDFSNEYYKTYYSVFYDSLQRGKIDSVMVSDVGGRDCGQCHY